MNNRINVWTGGSSGVAVVCGRINCSNWNDDFNVLLFDRWLIELFPRPIGLARDAHTHIGLGWCRQNNNSVPAASWRSGHHNSDHRFQRRTGDIQKLEISSVGFGRTNEHSTVLEMLLQQHRCDYLCGRFGGPRSNRNIKRRVAVYAEGEYRYGGGL